MLPDALGSATNSAGARTAVAVSAGGCVTVALIDAGASPGGGDVLARGERTVEVGVSGGSATRPAPGPGSTCSCRPRPALEVANLVALADVELLALRAESPAATPPGGEATGPGALASLRVTLRQAVYLTAADNFGREIRLLARPPGDRSGGAEAGGLAADGARRSAWHLDLALGRAEQGAFAMPRKRPCSTTPAIRFSEVEPPPPRIRGTAQSRM